MEKHVELLPNEFIFYGIWFLFQEEWHLERTIKKIQMAI